MERSALCLQPRLAARDAQESHSILLLGPLLVAVWRELMMVHRRHAGADGSCLLEPLYLMKLLARDEKKNQKRDTKKDWLLL